MDFLKLCIFFVLFSVAKNELSLIVKRAIGEPETIKSLNKKIETAEDNYYIINNLDDREHCLEQKPEYDRILSNGLLCEPIKTVYISKLNVYSCHDLYIPIWFYGFYPDTKNPLNFTSIFMQGFLNKGYGMNGSDAIQKTQMTTGACILYMRYVTSKKCYN